MAPPDTASKSEYLPPHKRHLAIKDQGVTKIEYLPPHKLYIAVKDQGSTLGSVAPPDTASKTEYLPPHKRLIATRDQGAMLGGVVPLDDDDDNDNDNDTDDNDDNDEVGYLGICPHDEFEHDDADGETVFHIKASCESFQLPRACLLGDGCTMGHDHPTVRRALIVRRKREARRKWVLGVYWARKAIYREGEVGLHVEEEVRPHVDEEEVRTHVDEEVQGEGFRDD